MSSASEDSATATSIQFSVASSHAAGGGGGSRRSSASDRPHTATRPNPHLFTPTLQPGKSRPAPHSTAQVASSSLALQGSGRQPPLSPQTFHSAATVSPPPPPLVRTAAPATPAASMSHASASTSFTFAEAPETLQPSRPVSPSDASLLFVQAVSRLDTPKQAALRVTGTRQHHQQQQQRQAFLHSGSDAESVQFEEDEDEEGEEREMRQGSTYQPRLVSSEKADRGDGGAAVTATSKSVMSSRGSIDFQEEDASSAALIEAQSPPPPRQQQQQQQRAPSADAMPAPLPPATLHVGNRTLVLKGPAPHGGGTGELLPAPSLPPPPPLAAPPLRAPSLEKALQLKHAITAAKAGRPLTDLPTAEGGAPAAAAHHLLPPSFPNRAGSLPSLLPGASSPTNATVDVDSSINTDAGATTPTAEQQQQQQQQQDGHHSHTPSFSPPITPRMGTAARGTNLHRVGSSLHGAPLGGVGGLGQQQPPHHWRVSSQSVQPEDDFVYCTVSEMTNATSMRGGTYSMLPMGVTTATTSGGAAAALSSRRLLLVPPAAVQSRRMQSFDMSLDESNAQLTMNTPRDVSAGGGVGGGNNSTTLLGSGSGDGGGRLNVVAASQQSLAGEGLATSTPLPTQLSASPVHNDLLHRVMPLPAFSRPTNPQRADDGPATFTGGEQSGGRQKTAIGPAKQPRQAATPTPRDDDDDMEDDAVARRGRTFASPAMSKQTTATPSPATHPPSQPGQKAAAGGREERTSLDPTHRRSSASAVLSAIGMKSLLCRLKSGFTASKSGTDDNEEERSSGSLRSRQSASHSIASGLSRMSSRVKRGTQKAISARRTSDEVPPIALPASASSLQWNSWTDRGRPGEARSEAQTGLETVTNTAATIALADPPTPMDSTSRGTQERGGGGLPAAPMLRLPNSLSPSKVHTAGSSPTRGPASSVDGSIDFRTDAEETKEVSPSVEAQGLHAQLTSNAPNTAMLRDRTPSPLATRVEDKLAASAAATAFHDKRQSKTEGSVQRRGIRHHRECGEQPHRSSCRDTNKKTVGSSRRHHRDERRRRSTSLPSSHARQRQHRRTTTASSDVPTTRSASAHVSAASSSCTSFVAPRCSSRTSSSVLSASALRRQAERERRRRRRERREQRHRKFRRRRAAAEGDEHDEDEEGEEHARLSRRRRSRKQRVASSNASSSSHSSKQQQMEQKKARSSRTTGHHTGASVRRRSAKRESDAAAVRRRKRSHVSSSAESDMLHHAAAAYVRRRLRQSCGRVNGVDGSRSSGDEDACRRNGKSEQQEEVTLSPAALLAARRKALHAASRVHSTTDHFAAAWHCRTLGRRAEWKNQQEAYTAWQRRRLLAENERKVRSQEAAVAQAVAIAASRSASRSRTPAVPAAAATVLLSAQANAAGASARRLEVYEAALKRDIGKLDIAIERLRRRELCVEANPAAAAAAAAATSVDPETSWNAEADTPEELKDVLKPTKSVTGRVTGPAWRGASGASSGLRVRPTPPLTAGPLSASSLTMHAYAHRLQQQQQQRRRTRNAARSADRSSEQHVRSSGGPRGDSSPAPRKPGSGPAPVASASVSSSLHNATIYEQRQQQQQQQYGSQAEKLDEEPSRGDPTPTPASMLASTGTTTTTTTADLQRRYEALLDELLTHAARECAPAAAATTGGDTHTPQRIPRGSSETSVGAVGVAGASPSRTFSRSPGRVEAEEAQARRCAEALRSEYYALPHSSLLPSTHAHATTSQHLFHQHVRGFDGATTEDIPEAVLKQLEHSYAQALRPSCSGCRPQSFDEYVALGLLSFLHGAEAQSPAPTDAAPLEAGSAVKQPPSTTFVQRRIREELYARPKRSKVRRVTSSQPPASPLTSAPQETTTAGSSLGVAAAAAAVHDAFTSSYSNPLAAPHPFTPPASLIFNLMRSRVATAERQARRDMTAEEAVDAHALRRKYIVETVCVLRALREREAEAEEAKEEQVRRRERRQERQQQSQAPSSLSFLHSNGGPPFSSREEEEHSSNKNKDGSQQRRHELPIAHEPVTPALAVAAPYSAASMAVRRTSAAEGHGSPPVSGLWRVPGLHSDRSSSSSTSSRESGSPSHRRRPRRGTDGGVKASEETDSDGGNGPNARSWREAMPPPQHAERMTEGGGQAHDRQPPVKGEREGQGEAAAVVRRTLQTELAPPRPSTSTCLTDQSHSPLSATRGGYVVEEVRGTAARQGWNSSGGGGREWSREVSAITVPGSPDYVPSTRGGPSGMPRRTVRHRMHSSNSSSSSGVVERGSASSLASSSSSHGEAVRSFGSDTSAVAEGEATPQGPCQEEDEEEERKLMSPVFALHSADSQTETDQSSPPPGAPQTADAAERRGEVRDHVDGGSAGAQSDKSSSLDFQTDEDEDDDADTGAHGDVKSAEAAAALFGDMRPAGKTPQQIQGAGEDASVAVKASSSSSSTTSLQVRSAEEDNEKSTATTTPAVAAVAAASSPPTPSTSAALSAVVVAPETSPSVKGTSVRPLSIDRGDYLLDSHSSSDADSQDEAADMRGGEGAAPEEREGASQTEHAEALVSDNDRRSSLALSPSSASPPPSASFEALHDAEAPPPPQQEESSAAAPTEPIGSTPVLVAKPLASEYPPNSKKKEEADSEEEEEQFEVHTTAPTTIQTPPANPVEETNDTIAAAAASTVVATAVGADVKTEEEKDAVAADAESSTPDRRLPEGSYVARTETAEAVDADEAAVAAVAPPPLMDVASQTSPILLPEEGPSPPPRRVRFSLPLEHANKPGNQEVGGDDEEGDGEEDRDAEVRAEDGRTTAEVQTDDEAAAPQPTTGDGVTPEKATPPSPPNTTGASFAGGHEGGSVADGVEEDTVSGKAAVDLLEKLRGLDALLLYKFPSYFTTGTDSDGLPGVVMRRGLDVYTPRRASLGVRVGSSPAASAAAAASGTGLSPMAPAPLSKPRSSAAVEPAEADAEGTVSAEEETAVFRSEQALGDAPVSTTPPLEHHRTPTRALSPSPLSPLQPLLPSALYEGLAPPRLPAESLASQLRRKYGLRGPPGVAAPLADLELRRPSRTFPAVVPSPPTTVLAAVSPRGEARRTATRKEETHLRPVEETVEGAGVAVRSPEPHPLPHPTADAPTAAARTAMLLPQKQQQVSPRVIAVPLLSIPAINTTAATTRHTVPSSKQQPV